MYIRCSILSHSIVGGKRSNVLYSIFPTDSHSSYTFIKFPYQLRWQKLTKKPIGKRNIKFTT